LMSSKILVFLHFWCMMHSYVRAALLSSYVKEGLLLGQLMGNRFTVTLR
jgi:hypothetical protein